MAVLIYERYLRDILVCELKQDFAKVCLVWWEVFQQDTRILKFACTYSD